MPDRLKEIEERVATATKYLEGDIPELVELVRAADRLVDSVAQEVIAYRVLREKFNDA